MEKKILHTRKWLGKLVSEWRGDNLKVTFSIIKW